MGNSDTEKELHSEADDSSKKSEGFQSTFKD